jgi:hypothetical protein
VTQPSGFRALRFNGVSVVWDDEYPERFVETQLLMVTRPMLAAQWMRRDFVREGTQLPISQGYVRDRGKRRGLEVQPIQRIPWKYLTREGRRIRRRVEDCLRSQKNSGS